MRFHIGAIVSVIDGRFVARDIDEIKDIVGHLYSLDGGCSALGLLEYADPARRELCAQFPQFVALSADIDAIDWDAKGTDKHALRDDMLRLREGKHGAYHDVSIAETFVRQMDDIQLIAKHAPEKLNSALPLDMSDHLSLEDVVDRVISALSADPDMPISGTEDDTL